MIVRCKHCDEPFSTEYAGIGKPRSVCNKCRHETRVRHYNKNGEKCRAYAIAWKRKNPEKVKEYNRRYAAEHREQIRKYAREYYRQHADKLKQRQRELRAMKKQQASEGE